ncbi:hypothetical protein [Caldivirga sp. UBA161]|uniref:hypothetical protein n=1 Tax=Caldivirga sp. UBA161 TaxID=1915569 RepID=UPI0025BE0E32|nr:hypothetical protein [Caldivirga sp. UBA161]
MATDSVNIEEKLAKALVRLISSSRGRRVTIKTATLVRLAGLDEKHRNILKAAKMLSKLSKERVIKIEFKDKVSRAKSIMYVVDDQMDLWRISKVNPDDAIRSILKSLERFKNRAKLSGP